MNRNVSLCVACNPPSAPPPSKKRGRKKARGQWDSDDEDESDGPFYPPGIMKVCQIRKQHGYDAEQGNLSLISHFSVRSSRMILTTL